MRGNVPFTVISLTAWNLHHLPGASNNGEDWTGITNPLDGSGDGNEAVQPIVHKGDRSSLLVLLLHLSGQSSQVVVDKYQAINGQFTCLDGSKSIPVEAINDDFCDCADGSDEPGTSACEGVGDTWFYCKNEGHVPGRVRSSRVNDGICGEYLSNQGVEKSLLMQTRNVAMVQMNGRLGCVKTNARKLARSIEKKRKQRERLERL